MAAHQASDCISPPRGRQEGLIQSLQINQAAAELCFYLWLSSAHLPQAQHSTGLEGNWELFTSERLLKAAGLILLSIGASSMQLDAGKQTLVVWGTLKLPRGHLLLLKPLPFVAKACCYFRILNPLKIFGWIPNMLVQQPQRSVHNNLRRGETLTEADYRLTTLSCFRLAARLFHQLFRSEKDEAMIKNAGLAAVKLSITMMFIDIIQFIITNSCILLQIQTLILSLFNFEGQQSGEKQQNSAACTFLS